MRIRFFCCWMLAIGVDGGGGRTDDLPPTGSTADPSTSCGACRRDRSLCSRAWTSSEAARGAAGCVWRSGTGARAAKGSADLGAPGGGTFFSDEPGARRPGSTPGEPAAARSGSGSDVSPPRPSRGLAHSTLIFSLATGLSRIGGLVRQVVAAYYFGAAGKINAFTVAFQLPNLVRALVADAASLLGLRAGLQRPDREGRAQARLGESRRASCG